MAVLVVCGTELHTRIGDLPPGSQQLFICSNTLMNTNACHVVLLEACICMFCPHWAGPSRSSLFGLIAVGVGVTWVDSRNLETEAKTEEKEDSVSFQTAGSKKSWLNEKKRRRQRGGRQQRDAQKAVRKHMV